MNAEHADARIGRLRDEVRELYRRRRRYDDLTVTAPDRVGECDGCHADRCELREDTGYPGEFAYCPACWRRISQRASDRVASQLVELRRLAKLAGVRLCSVCQGVKLGPTCDGCDRGE